MTCQLRLRLFDDEVSPEDPPATQLPEPTLEELRNYDVYIIMISGGKDSLASYLHLRDIGIPLDRIELWHQKVDGEETLPLMDWPVTPAYCHAFAQAFGHVLYNQHRVGGFEREMLRDDAPTAATRFETPDGVCEAGGKSAKRGTRRKFPQVSASLTTRWCSAYLKVDVAAIAIRNQTRFNGKRILVITGERAEESAARAKYAPFQVHKADARDGDDRRHVDHLRPVLRWSEEQVWAILERYRINPHPCYRLGWGRCSCALCIFGSDNQWASARAVIPEQFVRVANYEVEFDHTIRHTESIVVAADRGTPYAAINEADVRAVLSTTFDEPIILPDHIPWRLPAGAYGDAAGPT